MLSASLPTLCKSLNVVNSMLHARTTLSAQQTLVTTVSAMASWLRPPTSPTLPLQLSNLPLLLAPPLLPLVAFSPLHPPPSLQPPDPFLWVPSVLPPSNVRTVLTVSPPLPGKSSLVASSTLPALPTPNAQPTLATMAFATASSLLPHTSPTKHLPPSALPLLPPPLPAL